MDKPIDKPGIITVTLEQAKEVILKTWNYYLKDNSTSGTFELYLKVQDLDITVTGKRRQETRSFDCGMPRYKLRERDIDALHTWVIASLSDPSRSSAGPGLKKDKEMKKVNVHYSPAYDKFHFNFHVYIKD